MMDLGKWKEIFCRQVWYMCWKEMLGTFKDPRFRRVLLIPPILMGFLFGYAANFNLENITYALLDKSRTKASVSLAAHLDGTDFYHRVATLHNEGEIADPINTEKAMLVVVIPEDFVDKLEQGQNSPVQLITDGRYTMTSGLATAYTSRIISEWMLEQAGREPPISLQVRTWFNPNQLTRWFFSPGILGIMCFIQVVLLSGLSVAREREEGTFEQLLVTPAFPVVILIGKAFAPVVVGLIEGSTLLLIGTLWFEVPFTGNLLTLYFAMLLFFLASAGVGLAISANCQNMQQVQVYTSLYLVPNGILSGLFTPIRNMPEALQVLTYANPLRFALDAFRRIYFQGTGFWSLGYDFFPMLIIALVTLSFAGYQFRHNLN